MRFRSAFTTAVLVAVGCGSTNPQNPTLPPSTDDTTIGAGDVFDVRVYGEEELTNTYRVATDGTIDFPFIGRVDVVGLEPSTIAEQIATRLKDDGYLQTPQVSVFVREYNSKRVSVVGAVARPGTFPISPGMTVVQAISAAGGFTSLANRNETVLTRRTGTGEETMRVRVLAGDVAEGHAQDVPLRPGDIVFVPERIF